MEAQFNTHPLTELKGRKTKDTWDCEMVETSITRSYLWRHPPAVPQILEPSSRSSQTQPDSGSLSSPGGVSASRPWLHSQVEINIIQI